MACKLERERKITKGIKIQRYKKNERQGGKKVVEHHTQNNSFKQEEGNTWEKKMVLKRGVTVAQLCEYTENH